MTDLSRTVEPRRDILRIGAQSYLQHLRILHATLTAEPGRLTDLPVLSSRLRSDMDNLEFYLIRTIGNKEDWFFVRPFIGLGKVQGLHIVATDTSGWAAVQTLFGELYDLESLERLTTHEEVRSGEYEVPGDFSGVFERINHKAAQLSERGSLSVVILPRDMLFYGGRESHGRR